MTPRTDRPAAVLWDMDGTLVDTEPYWIAAEYELIGSYGFSWSDELAHSLVGNDLIVSAVAILEHAPMPLTPEEIVDWMLDRVTKQVRERIPFRPGALELLKSLGAEDVPCALVTMSYRSLTDAVLEQLPAGTFAAVVTGDEVANGKPHPEPYLTAAAQLGVDPARCMAIEDSPTGVRSAVAAGVPTLAVPHTVPIPPLAGSVQRADLVGLTTEDLAGLFATGG